MLECSVTAAFFNDHTHVRSGAKNLTRQLQMSKDEMYGLYRAHFPDLVRQAAARQAADPELHGPLSGFLTERLKVANEMSAVPLWSQVEELGRREEWYSRRTDEMRFERAANSTKSLQRISVQDDPDNIKARNSDTFWRMLKRCGVRFLRAKPDHQCKIHKDAPANKRQLATAQDDLVNMRKPSMSPGQMQMPRMWNDSRPRFLSCVKRYLNWRRQWNMLAYISSITRPPLSM